MTKPNGFKERVRWSARKKKKKERKWERVSMLPWNLTTRKMKWWKMTMGMQSILFVEHCRISIESIHNNLFESFFLICLSGICLLCDRFGIVRFLYEVANTLKKQQHFFHIMYQQMEHITIRININNFNSILLASLSNMNDRCTLYVRIPKMTLFWSEY